MEWGGRHSLMQQLAKDAVRFFVLGILTVVRACEGVCASLCVHVKTRAYKYLSCSFRLDLDDLAI